MSDEGTDRGFGPHWEHVAPTGANGFPNHQAPSIKCTQCEGWAADISTMAAKLSKWADWPGSDDDHDDMGRLIDGLKGIVALVGTHSIEEVGYLMGDVLALMKTQLGPPRTLSLVGDARIGNAEVTGSRS